MIKVMIYPFSVICAVPKLGSKGFPFVCGLSRYIRVDSDEMKGM
jgi:hypothetical protein